MKTKVQLKSEFLEFFFGTGGDLNPWQMCCRAVLISLICLALIRFCGSRAFGMNTPLDNVVSVLLGAILARAVVGASPFFGTVMAAGTIALVHRLAAWAGMYSRFFGKLVKGEAKVVYENGKFNYETMEACRITKHDLMEGIRLTSNLESFDRIKKVYVERNGKISVIKKEVKPRKETNPTNYETS